MTDTLLIKSFLKGLLSFLPGINKIISSRKKRSVHSGASAEFCYASWLYLLVFLQENKIKPVFKNFGEIGTGGSLGIGFCALFTGAEYYHALELDAEFDLEQNIRLLEEITSLFENRTPIPAQFGQINLRLKNHSFPDQFVKKPGYYSNLAEKVKHDLVNDLDQSSIIRISRKWETLPSLGLDFVYSRAVMEHVNDPNKVYAAIENHLAETGYMFHDIEFHSHGIMKNPVGHYNIPRCLWKFIFGKRPYFLNRWSLAAHKDAITSKQFELVNTQKNIKISRINDQEYIDGAVILAKKRT